MTYRIRYRTAGELNELEALVEANSPTEAVVKFRCTRRQQPARHPKKDDVTSVSPADRLDSAPEDEPAWG